MLTARRFFGTPARAMWRGLSGGVGRLGRRIAFWREERGVALTEFALIVPVFILIYVGAGELSQAAMTSRRVETLSRTLVDLVAQQPTSSQASSTPAPANATGQGTLQSILAAATAILAPSSPGPLTMTVSAIDIVNNASGVCCSFRVRWSYTQGGTLRPCNVDLTPVPPTAPPSPTTVSSAMTPSFAGSSLSSPIPMLISDVSYRYTGTFSSAWLDFATGMSRTSYMLPRTTGQVVVATPLTATANQNGAICY